MNAIYLADSPKEQKRLGRWVKAFDPVEWSRVSLAIMFDGLQAKFGKEALREKLNSTRPTLLVEASPYDAVWGIKLSMYDPRCLDQKTWQGRNLLGSLLTELRDLF